MISIVIPTFNNLDYLKLCIKSIRKNSKYNHEIKLHINDGSDGTLDFARSNNIRAGSSPSGASRASGSSSRPAGPRSRPPSGHRPSPAAWARRRFPAGPVCQ